MQLNDTARPFDGVFETNPSWLRPCPRFEILNPVVVSEPILLKNGFAIDQFTTEAGIHLQNGYKHASTASRSWMWDAQNH
jgi:hypothetical protein